MGFRSAVGALVLGTVLVAMACGGSESPTSSSSSSSASSSSSSGGSTSSSGGSTSDAGSSDGGDCRIEPLADPNATASGGPRGCTQPSDCTIRYYGDGCCPNQPQAVASGAVDPEANNGSGPRCGGKCQTVRCAAPPDATPLCVDGGCTL